MAAEFGVRTGPHMCEHSPILAGDMLITADMSLEKTKIRQTNMCLRSYLQLSQQRGTDKHAGEHGVGKVGQVKQGNVFQRQPSV